MSDDNIVELTGTEVAGIAAGTFIGVVSTALIIGTGGAAAPLVAGPLMTVGNAIGGYAGEKAPGAAIQTPARKLTIIVLIIRQL